jgi:glutaredoxin
MAKKVIVYWAEWCPYCHHVMDFLKKNKVDFEARDVEKGNNAEECMKRSGQAGIPVTLIDNQVVIGYDEKKLRELLSLK